jgi:hypothetical protein
MKAKASSSEEVFAFMQASGAICDIIGDRKEE